MLRANRRAMCGMALAIGAAATADVLYLNDGRIFEGQTVRDEQGGVSIDTMIGRIRTTLKFPSAEVNRIEERPLPVGFYEGRTTGKPEADTERAPRTRMAPDSTYYLEAPIRGEFGHDVLPRAIEETLDFAVRRGIEHVVFTIDSPGGEVWAADGIAQLLQRFADRVTCYAVVERAMSSAIWVAFSCERIYVAPSSAMGAAVVFERDETTGDAAVDEKITSAYAGILGGIAEEQGRSRAIARAMVDIEAELYTWMDGHGERQFGASPPRDTEYETLDTIDSVLTLTGEEMLRLGIADGRARASSNVGEAMGLPGWKQPIAFGTATAQKYAELARNARRGLRDGVTTIKARLEEARDHAPERFTYSTIDGEFTDSSLARWRDNVDRCHLMWRRIASEVSAYGQAIDDGEEVGLPLDFEALRRQHKEWKSEAGRRIAELKNQRKLTGK